MIPLIITPEVRARAKEIVAYAKTHALKLSDIQRSVKDPTCNVGRNPRHRLEIPCAYNFAVPESVTDKVVCFKVVYNLEEQPCGMCHHISMSIHLEEQWPEMRERVPHPVVFQMMCQDVFGIPQPLDQALSIWKEAVGDKRVAINALFLVRFDDPNNPELIALREKAVKAKVATEPDLGPDTEQHT